MSLMSSCFLLINQACPYLYTLNLQTFNVSSNVYLEENFCFRALIQHYYLTPTYSTYYKLFTLCSAGLTVYLCCPQVVSFFHRAMLTVGLAVLSLWPFLLGLFGKAKVKLHHRLQPLHTQYIKKV